MTETPKTSRRHAEKRSSEWTAALLWHPFPLQYSLLFSSSGQAATSFVVRRCESGGEDPADASDDDSEGMLKAPKKERII